jgi:hypothetical protein
MNQDQIYGLLRTLGVACMTYLVSSGALTDEQASTLTRAAMDAGPVLVALGLTAYGWYKKRDAGKALAADQIPGVTVTVNKFAAPPAVVEVAKAQTNTIKIVE